MIVPIAGEESVCREEAVFGVFAISPRISEIKRKMCFRYVNTHYGGIVKFKMAARERRGCPHNIFSENRVFLAIIELQLWRFKDKLKFKFKKGVAINTSEI